MRTWQALKAIKPIYIGDGVYAQVDITDPTRIILTTGTHKLDDADATIYLEQREMIAVRDFINLVLGEEKQT
jgi:hypothetical protein